MSSQIKSPRFQRNSEEFNEIFESLTKQEERVLCLFLEGKDDPAMAKILNCTQANVRSHLANICREFRLTEHESGCSHRDELIRLCFTYKGELVAPSRRKQIGIFELEYPSGRVPLDSYFYISRYDPNLGCYIESYCSEKIKKPGALISIKASKWTGKTSLISRLFAEAQKQVGVRTVEINFKEADSETLHNSEKFLRWFCTTVGKCLELEDRLTDFWQSSSGRRSNCTTYFERYLLPQINCPLVLGLDEVDVLFPFAVAEDFFTLLRLWHEKAKTLPIWSNLRLIIAHSTEVYVNLTATQSPFNVGIPIELSEFTPEQIKTLAIRHELRWWDSQVEDLRSVVGGHPYLIRLALYHLATQPKNLEQLLQQAPTEQGIYRDHLRSLLTILRQKKTLANSYRTVVIANSWVELDPMQIYLLSSMGLVKIKENQVMPSRHLYQQYFRQVL